VAKACALPVVGLSIASQCLLLGFYGPAMAANAARPGPIVGQPYSYVPWGYPQLEREIAAEQLRTQVSDGLAEVKQEMQALQQPMQVNSANEPDPHNAPPAKTPSAIAARDDHFAP